MDERHTPIPVLVASGVWLTVCLTAVAGIRVGHNPPWWQWVVVAVLVVPGMVILVRYERRRQGKTREPGPEELKPRSFGDLPSIQRTRLVIVTVSSAFIVLVVGTLAIVNLARGGFRPSDTAFLAIPLVAILVTAWLWWRLLRKPSPRMLQQEQRMRGMKGRTAFLPFILIVPAQWVGDLAFHAGGSEPREYTYAFVGNAVLVAVLVAVSERIRRQGSDGNRPPAAAS